MANAAVGIVVKILLLCYDIPRYCYLYEAHWKNTNEKIIVLRNLVRMWTLEELQGK